jgi:hypothetical protein
VGELAKSIVSSALIAQRVHGVVFAAPFAAVGLGATGLTKLSSALVFTN